MNFEKKTEPFTQVDAFMAGFTLQLFLIFFVVLSWSILPGECFVDAIESSADNNDDMEKFHNCVLKHRKWFEIGSVCLLISFPFIICHLYYEYRISQTVRSWLNFGIFDWLYSISWIIGATIYCTIIPALCIFICYYDWEFGDESDINGVNDDRYNTYKYIGYKVQFQFFHFMLILWDSCIIPLGISASIPWFRFFALINGCGKSSYYEMSNIGKEKILGMVLKLKFGRVVLSLIVLTIGLICLFGAFGDTFDFDKDGFWSFDGNSQLLQFITYFAIEIQCIMYFGFVCKYEEKAKFLNENVKPVSMASQDGAIQCKQQQQQAQRGNQELELTK